MNRKAWSFCPTYTAVGCFSSSCLGTGSFPSASGKNLQSASSLVTAAAADRGGGPRRREGRLGLSPWVPRARYSQTKSDTHPRAAGHAFVTTSDHPDSKCPFHPMALSRGFPQCHMLSLLAWLLVSTLKRPASPFGTHMGSDCCPVLLEGLGG